MTYGINCNHGFILSTFMERRYAKDSYRSNDDEKAAIGTNIRGSRELIIHKKTGLIVPVKKEKN